MYTKEVAVVFIKTQVLPTCVDNEYSNRLAQHLLALLREEDYLTKHYIKDVYSLLLVETERLLRVQETPKENLERLESIVMLTRIIRDSERFDLI